MFQISIDYQPTQAAKGFVMDFDNGLAISVQWGAFNYCDNYCDNRNSDFRKTAEDSETAEMAVMDIANDYDLLMIGENTTVLGYVGTQEVANWINRVATAKNVQDFKDRYCYYKKDEE